MVNLLSDVFFLYFKKPFQRLKRWKGREYDFFKFGKPLTDIYKCVLKVRVSLIVKPLLLLKK